ncbi:hypothetical protein GLOTRDRAFT_77041 [Gloeophyllum trabeum ATCC 11539]|uniref:T6SS Phospholipase effector Tle1-like catalytic domain-containing protein n=1 Tax=Gloeophyllum trabeum (strain ATCC 11539 / FP-39264 / Madison 617) TaxID=670483 RepID=S7Q4R0_GLOTA|nr:uncharacterized protein GLOTRDRAFT_77041 [Gloeophyllum trabeum ATCC 11539]EPQ54493.1 hypothetical protein GLOTRDRAFT_77041 [Gloeophyllum trabeum ATCC 11539]
MTDMRRNRNFSQDSGHGSTSTEGSLEYRPSAPWEGRDARRQWIPAEGPSTPRRRTIVLCFDGTGDQFDEDNSNIVQLMAMMRKDDASKQLVYYQAGIGTYTSPLIVGEGAAKVVKTLDEMFAITLPDHIKEGYEFLMQNYTIGDKICIFGFSRGAYTARALAGMLQKVGLLSKDNRQQLPFAYSMYKRDDLEGLQLSIMFKRTFSIDVKIEFLGVWDTVASVGLVDRDLPFVGTNNAIWYFRHALALDEHRAKFMPSYYHRSKYSEKQVDKKSQLSMAHIREESVVEEFEDAVNDSCPDRTDALEVWFAGAHCDIGGGSVRNNTRHCLARIPLRWMIRECFRTKTGILFDAKMLQDEVGLDLKTLDDEPPARTIKFPYQLVVGLIRPSKISLKADFFLEKTAQSDYLGEAEEELLDALSPIYDQLRLTWWWRILEWLPLRHKKQKANANPLNDKKEYVWSVNRGRGRPVFGYLMQEGMKVHRSVKTRLEALDGQGKLESYVPRVRPKLFSRKAKRFTHAEWNVEHPDFCQWVD